MITMLSACACAARCDDAVSPCRSSVFHIILVFVGKNFSLFFQFIHFNFNRIKEAKKEFGIIAMINFENGR